MPHEVFHLDTSVVFSERVVVPVDPRGDGLILNDDFCPRSPGFWKQHTELWPRQVLEIGGVEYDREELQAFLDANARDVTLALARQLVATKLNLLVGSDPFIVPVVEEADLFLTEHPPGSDPKGQERLAANALKEELDAYNNPDFCEEVPVVVVSARRKDEAPPPAQLPPPEAPPAEAPSIVTDTVSEIPNEMDDLDQEKE